jgi:hypothetical protein
MQKGELLVMKVVIQRFLYFFRNLFSHVRVASRLHIRGKKSVKEINVIIGDEDTDDSQKGR